MQAFSSFREQGLLFAVRELLIAVASRCRARALGARAQYFRPTGLVAPRHVRSSQTRNQTCAPSLVGVFLSTASPGKSCIHFYSKNFTPITSCSPHNNPISCIMLFLFQTRKLRQRLSNFLKFTQLINGIWDSKSDFLVLDLCSLSPHCTASARFNHNAWR